VGGAALQARYKLDVDVAAALTGPGERTRLAE